MHQENYTLKYSLKRYLGNLKHILSLFFSLFILFIPFLHAQTPCDSIREMIYEGLIAYYPFNGNANDESFNLNHGIVHDATLCPDRFGNLNSAYHFDGHNYLFTHQLPSNGWYNIVMVFEDNDCTLFVDNVEVASSSITVVAYPLNINNHY
jgi:hypothetical protein